MAKPKRHQWVKAAVQFWSETVQEFDIGVDWSDAETRCWRCGAERSLQKCHIVARQFGGGDSVDNIVPLCAECHDEAPDVTDAGEMWRWIRGTRPAYGYGTLKYERAANIARMRGVDFSRFDKDKFDRLMQQSVGLHLMQSGAGCRIKATSIAWAIEMACCSKEATDGTHS